jgi:4-amino-4-deoxy-L-arabinose transferase-like glycosyltransferase
VAIAVLSVIALYAIGTLLTNRAGGVVTALFFALHPLTKDTATRAWSDPLLVLLVALGALVIYRLAARPTWGRAVAFGVVLGLGGATKISPLLLAVIAAGVGVGLIVWTRIRRESNRSLDKLSLGLIASPVVAFALFVAVYPYLWTDPIGHTKRMFDFRTDSFEMQGEAFPPAKVAGRSDALRRVGDELGVNFSVGGLIADAFDRDDWHSLRNLDLGLALIGWILISTWILTRGPGWPAGYMAGLLAVEGSLIILTMGVEYARYLFPVLLAVAVGVGAVAGAGWDLVARWREREPEAIELRLPA